MQKWSLGLLAEYVTMLIYGLMFYKILHHRKRYHVGEVDIIALRGKTLIFIEVKARNSGINEKTLSFKQQNRIKKAAELFMASNSKYQNYDVRFDLVVVMPYKFPLIIKNAW